MKETSRIITKKVKTSTGKIVEVEALITKITGCLVTTFKVGSSSICEIDHNKKEI